MAATILPEASARAEAEQARQIALSATRAAQQMAETANRMKDEFLATIFASTMEGDLLSSEDQWRKLQLVVDTARRVWKDV